MSNLEQAARQALEALENTHDVGCKQTQEAITGLSQALAQAEKQEPCNPSCAPGYCYCKEMAGQPKQEPVAWLDKERNIIYMHDTHKTDECHGFRRTTPLYTAPPKREWVGLTDEEVRTAYCTVGDKEWAIGGMSDAEPFARAIENKLKEKNA